MGKAQKLTPKQARFVEQYLIDLNGTQAAIRAGFTKKNASSLAIQLLKKTHVLEAVTKAQEKRASRTEITADKVLRELALMGFANMFDYITTNENGDAFVDLSNLTREKAAAISEITTEEYKEGRGGIGRAIIRTKIKLHDKRGSLELIARHLGMFNDKLELTGDAIFKVYKGIEADKV